MIPGTVELPQIARTAKRRQRGILIKERLQRNRIGDVAAIDEFSHRLENAAVYRVVEMLGPQGFGIGNWMAAGATA